MKTKVRIQHSEFQNYNHMHIQILEKRWKDSNSFESPGYIQFQQTKGEDNWYGIRFQVDTSSVRDLEIMTKLAKFIKENSTHNTQPDEILKLIGAEQHVVFNGDFIPFSYAGKFVYNVIVDDKLYTKIYADSEKMANKQLKKLKLADAKMLVIGVVEIPKHLIPA